VVPEPPMPKGGMPKAAATDAGGSKTQDEIAAEEERRLAELGSPMAQRTLTIPRSDAGGMSGTAWLGLTRSNYTRRQTVLPSHGG
jgi:hypothetical protein